MRPRFALLSKLPKAKRWTSANFRFQTPGLVEPFFPGYTPYKNGYLGGVLDPGHPAVSIRGNFPKTSDVAFGGRIYPIALLITGNSAFGPGSFMKWQERVEKARQDGFSGARVAGRIVLCRGVDQNGEPLPYKGTEQVYPQDDHNTLEIPKRNATPRQPFLKLALKRAARRVPMSFSVATSKKRMGTLAFMRVKIVKRIRGVLDLILSRGAYVNEGQEPATIALNEDDAGRKWSLQGWTYLFFPTTDIYRMPLPELITLVRKTLQDLNRSAIRQENAWLADALFKAQSKPSPPPIRTSIAEHSWNANTIKATSANSFKSDYEIMYRIRKPPVNNPSKSPKIPSFTSTGGKSREAWKAQLEEGLALLTKHAVPGGKKTEVDKESPAEK